MFLLDFLSKCNVIRRLLHVSVSGKNDVGRRKMKENWVTKRLRGQHKHVVRRAAYQESDVKQCDGATHQILVTETSELLKLLRYEELSTAYCTADCPQHYKREE